MLARTLSSYGTKRAIAKLAVRLLLMRIFGPIGIAFELYDLLQAIKASQSARPDLAGGWEIIEDCGRPPVYGPYPGWPPGCAPNKAAAEADAGTYSTSGSVHDTAFYISQFKLNGQPSNVVSGIRTGLMGMAVRNLVEVPYVSPPVPMIIPAVDAKPAVIQPLADPAIWDTPLGRLPEIVKTELAEWPQSYESVEPSNYARWNPVARTITKPRIDTKVGVEVPNFSYEWSVTAISTPDTKTTTGTPGVTGTEVTPKIVTDTRLDPEPPTYTPTRTRKGEREVKMRARAGYGAVMAIIGTATEALDLFEALYKALPERYKIKGRSRFMSRVKRVWEAAKNGDLNFARSAEEIFWNQMEDMLFGGIGRLQASAVRRLAEQGLWGGPFGTTVGGANRQEVTRLDGVKVPSPTDSLRALMEPYYRSYIPRE